MGIAIVNCVLSCHTCLTCMHHLTVHSTLQPSCRRRVHGLRPPCHLCCLTAGAWPLTIRVARSLGLFFFYFSVSFFFVLPHTMGMNMTSQDGQVLDGFVDRPPVCQFCRKRGSSRQKPFALRPRWGGLLQGGSLALLLPLSMHKMFWAYHCGGRRCDAGDCNAACCSVAGKCECECTDPFSPSRDDRERDRDRGRDRERDRDRDRKKHKKHKHRSRSPSSSSSSRKRSKHHHSSSSSSSRSGSSSSRRDAGDAAPAQPPPQTGAAIPTQQQVRSRPRDAHGAPASSRQA